MKQFEVFWAEKRFDPRNVFCLLLSVVGAPFPASKLHEWITDRKKLLENIRDFFLRDLNVTLSKVLFFKSTHSGAKLKTAEKKPQKAFFRRSQMRENFFSNLNVYF